MLKRVISGGQTGVDQAALAAARVSSILTGGWAPKGWKTSRGPMRILLMSYGLIECPTPGYKARTFANVRISDATLRLAFDFTSPGEICTLRGIEKYGRPHIDIDLGGNLGGAEVKACYEWIMNNEVHTLNVAGNRKRDACVGPDVYDLSFDFLCQLFALKS